VKRIFPILSIIILIIATVLIADTGAVIYVSAFTEDNSDSPSVQSPVDSMWVYWYKDASTVIDSAFSDINGVVRFDTTIGSSMRLITKDTNYVLESIQVDVSNAETADTLAFGLRMYESAACSLQTVTFTALTYYGQYAVGEPVKVVEMLASPTQVFNSGGDKGAVIYNGQEPQLETTLRTNDAGQIEYKCFKYSSVFFYHRNRLITYKADITANTDITSFSPTF
jgi:hypothetical protein